MFQLNITPYILENEIEGAIVSRLRLIEERMAILRSIGTLNQKTLQEYYGQKRFEQVAESNALEGNTLSAGETELAVLRGITITGHDPAYVRDAVALDKALMKVCEIARDNNNPTDIEQLQQIHSLLLGDRPGAGVFRSVQVSIRGAKHAPPKTWHQIMNQMEDWQRWSAENRDAPAPLRAAILHAWLTHIHPFIDGNGRVARAIGNLELIRSGYPPIIIKKKERGRYIDALAESDDAGDIRSFIDLVFERIDGPLTGLENAARKIQGYNPVIEKIRKQQEQQLHIWNTSVKLLASTIEYKLSQLLESVRGSCSVKLFEDTIDFDEYMELCAGRSISGGWAFIVGVDVPGVGRFQKLAFIGHRSSKMYNKLHQEGGPSLYWAGRNPVGFPKWKRDDAESPYAAELTSRIGRGDEWVVRLNDGSMVEIKTTTLAERIASTLINNAI